MLRVLVITYYWPPAGGAGVQRWLKLCKYLPEHGVMPTVITVDPDKASYPQRDDSLLNEVRDDIEVIRTNSFEPLQIYGKLFGKEKVPYGGFANTANEGFLSKASRFVRGNFFIPDARKGWNKYAFAAAKKAIADKSIDIVITTGPPHSTHLVGLQLKKELGVKWVADFRDPWTGIYYYDELLHTKWAKRRDRAFEKDVLDGADLVFSVCQSNLMSLRQLASPSQRDKLALLTNGFDHSDFKKRPAKSERFQIGYTGTLADLYNPEPILKLLSGLQHEMDFILKIAGRISPGIEQYLESIGLADRLNFIGYVEHAKAIEVLQQSHLLLHILPRTSLNEQGTTGKLFDYIGSGTSILNIGPQEGDSALIIDEARAGKTFDQEDLSAMRDHLKKQYQNFLDGVEVRSGQKEKFERSVQAKRVAGLFEKLQE